MGSLEIKQILERLGYPAPEVGEDIEEAFTKIARALRDMERQLRRYKDQEEMPH